MGLSVLYFLPLCERAVTDRCAFHQLHPENPEHPTIIRPLALVPEELLKDTAAANDFPEAGSCRYEELLESGDRQYFRTLADTLSQRIPDFRSNFVRSLGHIEPEHLMITPALLSKITE